MIKQKQLFRHNPPETFGDCQRTVIACLLNKRQVDVPNFGVFYEDGEKFFREVDAYLATQGLARVTIYYACKLDEVLAMMGAVNPTAYYILGGASKNGTNHVVIGLGGAIAWDPAIDNSGIVGPADNGHYSVEFLVPLSATQPQFAGTRHDLVFAGEA